MRALIVFDHVTDCAKPDQADALVQARAVAGSLEELGHEWVMLGVTLDLEATRGAVERLHPDVVFNLVESLGGHGRLIHVVPALLDAMSIPYTGATADAQFITSHKPLAKQLMRAAKIDTPAWVTMADLEAAVGCRTPSLPGRRWLIKSLWEHASVGLDDDCLIDTQDAGDLRAAIEQRLDQLGGDGFAEAYIDGREFNLALLGSGNGAAPQVLPPSEIVFLDYEADRPRIVNYRCKWDETSFESQHTLRRLDFARDDAPLLQRLEHIALQCWQAFDLRGYARVDFRVDAEDRPWVLEVNTNPCLSPDAGFAAALRHANIAYTLAIERILQDTLARVPARA